MPLEPRCTPYLGAWAWIVLALEGSDAMVGECGRMVDQNPTLGSLPESYVGNHVVWNVEEV